MHIKTIRTQLTVASSLPTNTILNISRNLKLNPCLTIFGYIPANDSYKTLSLFENEKTKGDLNL